MIKNILGFAFLIIASFLIIYFIHGIYINPHSLLILKKVFSGEEGQKFTSFAIIFHSIFFIMIFILFRVGIKWVKPSKTNFTLKE